MCGICGVAAIGNSLNPDIRAAMPAMTHALRHRGPDGDGFYSDEFVALGHRRLAIIDRAGGRQPIANEDSSCWIVFNGEVYNHRPLRAQLQSRGHVFRTDSDTEAILHAYEEYGTSCVDRLEGMFAFAIYDQRRREVFLARDRLGKKPLFYATFADTLHFASEIKALYQSPAWDDSFDPAGLEMYLSLGYFVAPRTAYRHVRQLEPGHWLLLRDGSLERRQYWDIQDFDNDDRDTDAIKTDLETLLREAVAERLESEVPLGAFLSGGIDSGVVVSFMAESLGNRLITTSVGFEDRGHNELDAASLVAQRFETQHHPEVIEPQLDESLRALAGFDEPFADSSAVPTYYLSRMTRKHVTVALSGDGGDEGFGGYDFRYVPHAIEGRIRRAVPSVFPSSVLGALGRRWPRSRRLPKALRVGSLLENLSRHPAEAYYFDLCFLKPWDVRLLLGSSDGAPLEDSPSYQAVVQPYLRCPSPSPVQCAQYADVKIYLPNDVLAKVDRMSMASGLEIRCPLLDRRVLEFAFRLSTHTKMPGLRSKHLLRTLARDRLPQSILRAAKHGFTAPVARWLAGPQGDRFREEVLASGSGVRELLDMARVRTLFEEHRTSKRDWSYALWAVWMLERWISARIPNTRDAAVSIAGTA